MNRVRLAELCASTSLFTDLGTGQPVEHGLRTAIVSMRLADALRLDDATRREAYYVTLLRFLGCTADAHLVAGLGEGDDVRILAGAAPFTMGSPREDLMQMIRMVGKGAPLLRRLVTLARALSEPGAQEKLLRAHCEVASRLAEEIGLPVGVRSALEVAYARWDGKGVPAGLGGNDIPLSVRVAIVARDLEIWGRDAGADEATRVLTERRGRAYDPSVVEAAVELGVDQLRRCDDDPWEVVLDAEPHPRVEVTGPGIDRALSALADFADLKVPESAGHSRRVARLVATAADGDRRQGVDREMLFRAGLVHDLGMVAVPAGAQQSEVLTPSGWEQLRMHPIWTQRILSRCTGLARVGKVAGRHHEYLDGSGYPAGMVGEEAHGACLLACAEMYDEMTSPGRGRPTFTPAAAAEEMTRLVADGALASQDLKAILDAAGVARPIVELGRPAGLTEREVDVLALLARGRSNRQIAETLGISPKTVGTHVEHIYAKVGVTTRAAATLFAVQNGLI